MVRLERNGAVGIILLDSGVTNPLSEKLIERLGAALVETRQDAQIRGLVLASTSEKFFSIGFDLPALYDLDRASMQSFYERYTQVCLELYTWPGPTAAAVVGHAIAGGCILALCCDYRVVASGRTLTGLNEIVLGVPVPHLPQLILQDLVGARIARQLLDTGELIDAERQLAIGYADRVTDKSAVLPSAIEKITDLAALPSVAFTAIKRARVEAIEACVRARCDSLCDEFVSCWFSPEARELLGAAREKF